ncbi:MAG: hypothetical protein NC453_14865 [Muribaculum sp.]|nr:hypothetical protein [Muribaculum sp.]
MTNKSQDLNVLLLFSLRSNILHTLYGLGAIATGVLSYTSHSLCSGYPFGVIEDIYFSYIRVSGWWLSFAQLPNIFHDSDGFAINPYCVIITRHHWSEATYTFHCTFLCNVTFF